MLYITRQEDSIECTEAPICTKPLWSASVQIRTPFYKDHMMIVFHSNRKPSPKWIPSNKYTYNFHILISNFQKTMRRKEFDSCLATTLQLLGQDAAAFLRRLAVVLLEDSQLHPRLYNEVVWLMAAVSKGYVLTIADIGLIMDAITTALHSWVRYNLVKEGRQVDSRSASATWIAIQLRADAGGMKWDTAFLRRLADRYADADLPVEDEWYSINIEDIPEFNITDHIILEAVDFHCCPAILKVAGALVAGAGDAKEAIWWHRSSLNVRVLEDEEAALKEEDARAKTLEAWRRCQRAVREFSERQVEQLGRERVEVKAVQTLDKWFAKC